VVDRLGLVHLRLRLIDRLRMVDWFYRLVRCWGRMVYRLRFVGSRSWMVYRLRLVRCWGRMVRLLLWVVGGAFIGDLSHVSVVVVSGVLHMLSSPVRKLDGVGASHHISIRALPCSEVSLAVVIGHCILISVRLCRIFLFFMVRFRVVGGLRMVGWWWGRRRRVVGCRLRFVKSWCWLVVDWRWGSWLVVGRNVGNWSIYWSWCMVRRRCWMVGSRGVNSMNSVVRSVVEADTNTGHLTMTDYGMVTLVR